MKVILKKDVENLGKCWDIKNVAEGYARNYLLPKEIAIPATEKNIKMIDVFKLQQEAKVKRAIHEKEQIKEKLEGLSLTINVKAGEDDKLFGSVTASNIAEALEKQGINIDKKKIVLEEPLKELGIYNIGVKIGPELNAEIKVWIVKE